MYKAEAVTYEDLLEAAKEAESEFLETRRGAQLKAASVKGGVPGTLGGTGKPALGPNVSS